MSADAKKVEKLEPQPIKAIKMPEYRYQEHVVTEHNSATGRRAERKDAPIDLRGVALNLS